MASQGLAWSRIIIRLSAYSSSRVHECIGLEASHHFRAPYSRLPVANVNVITICQEQLRLGLPNWSDFALESLVNELHERTANARQHSLQLAKQIIGLNSSIGQLLGYGYAITVAEHGRFFLANLDAKDGRRAVLHYEAARQGYLTEERSAREQNDLAKASRMSLRLAKLNVNLVYLLSRINRNEVASLTLDAKELYDSTASVLEDAEMWSDLGNLHMCYAAYVCDRMGNLSEGQNYLNLASEAYRQAGAAGQRRAIALQFNRAYLFRENGDYDESLALF